MQPPAEHDRHGAEGDVEGALAGAVGVGPPDVALADADPVADHAPGEGGQVRLERAAVRDLGRVADGDDLGLDLGAAGGLGARADVVGSTSIANTSAGGWS